MIGGRTCVQFKRFKSYLFRLETFKPLLFGVPPYIDDKVFDGIGLVLKTLRDKIQDVEGLVKCAISAH